MTFFLDAFAHCFDIAGPGQEFAVLKGGAGKFDDRREVRILAGAFISAVEMAPDFPRGVQIKGPVLQERQPGFNLITVHICPHNA